MSDIETQVRNFYNNNYKRFDVSRCSVWNAVKDFIDLIPQNSFVLDAGCGNGKNMIYIQNRKINVVGIDFSTKLLDICKSKSLNVKEADIRHLPYDDNTFDYVISIAVIHHLSTQKNRIKAIDELLRVCKPYGKILISVWALEQEKNSRFSFTLGDNYVKWEDTTRYYHIHNRNTITNLLKNYIVETLFLDKGNWFLILNK